MILSGNIVWLASYPKSGNTWLRVILDALLARCPLGKDPNINALQLMDHAGNRGLVEAVSACPSSELHYHELDWLRPASFRLLDDRSAELKFVKVHDAYRLLNQCFPLFPADVSRHVIYIVRNPLDVAVSFSAHLNICINETISLMSNNFSLSSDESAIGSQVQQQLGCWSFHAASWTQQQAIPVTVVRYEDLAANTEAAVSRIAEVLRLRKCKAELVGAIEAARFERLQALEAKAGFREKPASHTDLFFRSGRVGEWRDVLTEEQSKRVERKHREMMGQFGYL